MARILVIEDDLSLNKLVCRSLDLDGHSVKSVKTKSDALKEIENNSYDLVLLDLMLPDGNGMDLIERIVRDSAVIVISAHADVNMAVKAVQMGAFNFIPKPFELENLTIEVNRALETRSLKLENISLKLPTKIVGESPSIRKLRDMIQIVASRDVPVFITGESGTGKELVARSIWELSTRSKSPFVAVNCGAIPEDLFESELFGYERGAFTGANTSKPGKFEMADGGVIFLDEIGELPKNVQVKLLRVLENSQIERLGGVEPIHINVRVLSATNRNIEEEVKAGNFRDDLYYRINVVRIEVPPLRDRIEDIPLLADYFAKLYSKQMQVEYRPFSQKALNFLKSYPFPGNIRELQNIVKSALIFARGKEIEIEDLSNQIQDVEKNYVKIQIGESLESAERKIIEATLEYFNGNKTQAAKALNIGLSTLHNKLNQWREDSEDQSSG
ncbi:sigma-54-dependent transcriptional regulator [Athalassotoga saccharophila]|uniref:sigma-54-dependent transcriptional regulator n=1 Tax=Athalassotoga saccharophila TaxID=1441386 RepID=UPI001379A6B2|nr:sigma-54 dependent transcriptional regulator [Athalassotoga saccharophila]BBJ27766.1 DNA-binding transcriptional regulator NtrC [Athalassotoga saccharophila]